MIYWQLSIEKHLINLLLCSPVLYSSITWGTRSKVLDGWVSLHSVLLFYTLVLPELPGAKYLMVGYPCTPYSCPTLWCWVASRAPKFIFPKWKYPIKLLNTYSMNEQWNSCFHFIVYKITRIPPSFSPLKQRFMDNIVNRT